MRCGVLMDIGCLGNDAKMFSFDVVNVIRQNVFNQEKNVVYWNPNGRSSIISCAIKSFKRHSQGMSLFMVCVFVF